MKHQWTILLTLILLLFNRVQAESISLVNANILNATGTKLQLSTINITNGIINSVTPSTIQPKFEKVIDLNYGLVLPGLIDMHSHGWGNASLRNSGEYQYIGFRGTANAMLYAGVHGWLDLFSDEAKILSYRDAEHPKTRNEAQIFAAGPCFTATGGHCDFPGHFTRIVNNPEDVKRVVAALLLNKPNVLKVVYHNTPNALPTIDKATLATFLQEAKRANVPSVVHVGSWKDIRTASELGASAITHLPWTRMPEDIPELLKRNNTAVIPTVGLIAETLHLNHNKANAKPRPLDILRNTLVDEKLRTQFPIKQENQMYNDWLAKTMQRHAMTQLQRSIQLLVESEVNILVGSDSANEGMYQGVGYHVELYHLQQLGMPTSQLLKAATKGAYEFLDINWGIKPNAPANFVVTSADSLQDIAQLAKIEQIFVHGRNVERKDLLTYATPNFWQYTKLFLGFED